MSETHFELRVPVTPLSVNLKECEGWEITPGIVAAVERLEAINAALLAALEACYDRLRAWQESALLVIAVTSDSDCRLTAQRQVENYTPLVELACEAIKQATGEVGS